GFLPAHLPLPYPKYRRGSFYVLPLPPNHRKIPRFPLSGHSGTGLPNVISPDNYKSSLPHPIFRLSNRRSSATVRYHNTISTPLPVYRSPNLFPQRDYPY